MPIIAAKAKAAEAKGQKMPAEEELMMISAWGKCHKRLDRVLRDRKPNVDYKNDDGMTALHHACVCGSGEFVERLLAAKADPNVPATASLSTPLDVVLAKIQEDVKNDKRLNTFDEVNRLDDTCVAVRPDLKGWYRCRDLLQAAGAVEGKCHEESPNVKPDGSVNGGPSSELRAYSSAEDGSYTAAHHLRSGKYDVLKYENGYLIRADFDPKTGHWDVGEGLSCKDQPVESSK